MTNILEYLRKKVFFDCELKQFVIDFFLCKMLIYKTTHFLNVAVAHELRSCGFHDWSAILMRDYYVLL